MVTSIVKNVQSILSQTNSNCKVEIVFPVASDAVAAGSDESVLPLVPGVSGGEGCSTAGGCATCPYMKMNSLDSLMEVLSKIQSNDSNQLQAYLPPSRLQGQFLRGRPAMEWGTEPIQYMRHFSANQQLPDALVQRVVGSS